MTSCRSGEPDEERCAGPGGCHRRAAAALGRCGRSEGRGLVATETLILLPGRRIPASEDPVERHVGSDVDGRVGELVEVDRAAPPAEQARASRRARDGAAPRAGRCRGSRRGRRRLPSDGRRTAREAIPSECVEGSSSRRSPLGSVTRTASRRLEPRRVRVEIARPEGGGAAVDVAEPRRPPPRPPRPCTSRRAQNSVAASPLGRDPLRLAPDALGVLGAGRRRAALGRARRNACDARAARARPPPRARSSQRSSSSPAPASGGRISAAIAEAAGPLAPGPRRTATSTRRRAGARRGTRRPRTASPANQTRSGGLSARNANGGVRGA